MSPRPLRASRPGQGRSSGRRSTLTGAGSPETLAPVRATPNGEASPAALGLVRRPAAAHDDRVNDWLRARNGWTLLPLFWGVTLPAVLLGTALEPLFAPSPTSFAAQLPWAVGGSLFVAACITIGLLARRRWLADDSAR